jgi:hypothetical protein
MKVKVVESLDATTRNMSQTQSPDHSVGSALITRTCQSALGQVRISVRLETLALAQSASTLLRHGSTNWLSRVTVDPHEDRTYTV